MAILLLRLSIPPQTATLMSPQSPPKLTAMQKVTAQKGATGRTTMVTVQGGAGLSWQINHCLPVWQVLQ